MPYLIGNNVREVNGISFRDGDIVDCTIENDKGRFDVPGACRNISTDGRLYICSDGPGCRIYW